MILTGKQLKMRYDVQNDSFDDDSKFMLLTINKNELINKSIYDGSCDNYFDLNKWEQHGDNYDNYHTDTISNMIDYLKEGGNLPPLIVNKNLGLYDGQHRLTAYMELDSIINIEIFKEE